MKRAVQVGLVVTQYLGRTALSHRIFTGLRHRRLGTLIGELAQVWMAAEEGRRYDRRGHDRLRATGAGPEEQVREVAAKFTTIPDVRVIHPASGFDSGEFGDGDPSNPLGPLSRGQAEAEFDRRDAARSNSDRAASRR